MLKLKILLENDSTNSDREYDACDSEPEPPSSSPPTRIRQ
jgi:hypothetical protein